MESLPIAGEGLSRSGIRHTKLSDRLSENVISWFKQAKALTTVGVLCFFYGGSGYDDNRNVRQTS